MILDFYWKLNSVQRTCSANKPVVVNSFPYSPPNYKKRNINQISVADKIKEDNETHKKTKNNLEINNYPRNAGGRERQVTASNAIFPSKFEFKPKKLGERERERQRNGFVFWLHFQVLINVRLGFLSKNLLQIRNQRKKKNKPPLNPLLSLTKANSFSKNFLILIFALSLCLSICPW